MNKVKLMIVLAIAATEIGVIAQDEPSGLVGASEPRTVLRTPMTGTLHRTASNEARSASGGALIVLSRPVDDTVMSEMEEDLNVMMRILEKAAGQQLQPVPPVRLGVVLQSFGKERPQSVYIDGYGVLFLLRTRIPLLGSPASKPAGAALAPSGAWAEARRELYGGPGEPMPEAGNEPPPAYDEQLVKTLNRQLLEALANAANIRHLKSSEYITVVVVGAPAASTEVDPLEIYQQRYGSLGGMTRGGSFVAGGAGYGGRAFSFSSSGTPPASPPGTTETIRVTKADVDAVAAGKLSQGDFIKKAAIQAYSGNAPDEGVIESFWRR